jgi:hypothetical protein
MDYESKFYNMSSKDNEERTPSFWEIYMDDIGAILKRIPQWVTVWQTQSSKLRDRAFIGLCVILGMLIVTVGALASQGIVSGDSVVFLAGTIIGYIFAILHKYLGVTKL